MSGKGLKITRLEEGTESNRYRCEWELGLGDVKGAYSIEETVRCGSWKETTRANGSGGDDERVEGGEDGEIETDEKKWQRRYLDMCEAVKKRDKELANMKAGVLQALKGPGRD